MLFNFAQLVKTDGTRRPSVWQFQMRRGGKFRSGADPPLEVVSGPHYWWAIPVQMDMLEAQSRDTSVWLVWPNKSKCNCLWPLIWGKTNTAAVHGEWPVLPPVLPTLPHISARKTASVPGKKTLTHRVFVMKINLCNGQPSRLRLQWTFPRKQPPSLRVRESNSILFTDANYVIM